MQDTLAPLPIFIGRSIRWLGRKLGYVVTPFLITAEDLQPANRPHLQLNPKFTLRELSEADLPGIHNLRPDMSLPRYASLMKSGVRCFGIYDQDLLIAKMWLHLAEFNSELYTHPLEADEAYLFDAFANPDYRGQNLAPILRLHCYQVARELGRQRIYSITEFLNLPARGFKRKLPTAHARLLLFIGKKRQGKVQGRSYTLRRYSVA